jgi:hypothetical protein
LYKFKVQKDYLKDNKKKMFSPFTNKVLSAFAAAAAAYPQVSG